MKKPEALNRFLHELTIKMCSELEKKSWQIKVDFPATGTPVYSEDVEGKQTRLPKVKELTKPSHSMIIAAAEMEETDEKRCAKMPSRLRDQKRAFHKQNCSREGAALVSAFHEDG